MADAKDILVTLAADLIKEVGRTIVDKVKAHARQHLAPDMSAESPERDAMFQRQLDDLYNELVKVGQAFESTVQAVKSETTEVIERDGSEEFTKPYEHLK